MSAQAAASGAGYVYAFAESVTPTSHTRLVTVRGKPPSPAAARDPSRGAAPQARLTRRLASRCRAEARGRDRPDNLITKLAPVEFRPGVTAPNWLRFLERVQPDSEIRDYLRRMVGYAATGVIREHFLAIMYGEGRNGKGVFHSSTRRVLGDYAKTVPAELLVEKRNEAHPTERMVLLGCRFAQASETREGCSLNVAQVKALTGGDSICARLMRENFVEFRPTHKLSLATNHRPRIKETKGAIWERVHLVPWAVVVPEAERNLKLEDELVRDEGAGILAWIVAGCLEWQRIGLNPPNVIRTATRDYRGDEDPIAPFLSERCVLSATCTVSSASIWGEYEAWCGANGENPLGRRHLTERLQERGLSLGKGAKGLRVWRGIGLASQYPEIEVAQGGAISPMTPKTPLAREGIGKSGVFWECLAAPSEDG